MTLITPLELFNIIAGLKAKFDKDAYRIALFQAVVFKRIGEIATTNPTQALPFAEACAQILGAWAARGADLVKNPWSWLFRDPFKDLRNQMRDFAVTWSLDKSFVDAMGPK